MPRFREPESQDHWRSPSAPSQLVGHDSGMPEAHVTPDQGQSEQYYPE